MYLSDLQFETEMTFQNLPRPPNQKRKCGTTTTNTVLASQFHFVQLSIGYLSLNIETSGLFFKEHVQCSTRCCIMCKNFWKSDRNTSNNEKKNDICILYNLI